MRAVSLTTLMKKLPYADVVHMDIQEAEYQTLSATPPALLSRIKLILVGTHSKENERSLRNFFGRLGWSCLYDFPMMQKSETQYGPIEFGDGVQIWRNPAPTIHRSWWSRLKARLRLD